MELDLQQESAIATVIAVESLPCSMLGQKKILRLRATKLNDDLFTIITQGI
ncbi:MAG: hypothetical protein M0021_11330 [Clostridia bacterium]|nr:hypothetical protein [Clostridia bacterium]